MCHFREEAAPLGWSAGVGVSNADKGSGVGMVERPWGSKESILVDTRFRVELRDETGKANGESVAILASITQTHAIVFANSRRTTPAHAGGSLIQEARSHGLAKKSALRRNVGGLRQDLSY
jgi:hypothetical protein